jgi:uncharacterized caspase-like protein
MKRRGLLALGGAALAAPLCPARAAAPAAAAASAARLGSGERRVALVIGNSAYAEVPLRNPGNDATAVHRALRGLGFDARLVRDADWRQMIEVVQAFVTQTANADVRVVYYAGHGAQVRGRNYLIAVDAPMTSAEELAARSLDAAEVLERLSRHRRGLNLLILDACRNNPANQYQLMADGRRIKVRGAPGGLAAMQAPAGAMVAFATAPGSFAADGSGESNSLYTRHLLRHLATPGIALEQMFKRVRVGVMQESAQRQRPWEESSLTTDYCLAGC